MIVCTFTPGPFLGSFEGYEEWLAHVAGVIVADYLCGGPQVNPAVTIAMFVWRKISGYQVLLYIAAQMAGGIVAFPLLQSISTPYKAVIGGPEVGPEVTVGQGMFNEGVAMFLLMLGIYAFATTAIGNVYPVKQPLIAAVIRACIYYFGTTGPAMNPALGTTWAFYKSQSTAFPTDAGHYAIYWGAAMAGAAVATLLWSVVTSTGPFGEDTAGKAPDTLRDVWSHHVKRLTERKTDELLRDFAPNAKVTVQYLPENSRGTDVRSTDAKKNLEVLFNFLKGLREEDVIADVEELSETTILYTWRAPSRKLANATTIAVFDSNLKITRYNVTILFQ